MQHDVVRKMGEREQALLHLSFRPALAEKRIRNIVLSTLLILVGVIAVSIYGVGIATATAVTLTVLIVSAVEKVTYSREILVYKSLVRDLSHRIAELEGVSPERAGEQPAAPEVRLPEQALIDEKRRAIRAG